MMPEMTINGEDIKRYHARLLSYSVGGTALTHSASASGEVLRLNRVYHTILAPRSVTITLTFSPASSEPGSRGTSISERLTRSTRNIIRFESVIIGKTVEIGLPDGYYYTGYLTASQPAIFDATGEQDVVYTFAAIRHELQKEQTVSSGRKIICRSNTKTPCKIKFKLSSAQSTVAVCGVIIKNVAANTEIVIDSVNGLITAGGTNKFTDTEFVDFPYLSPGENVISCSVPGTAITVVYTPVYA